jgi:hypothetical protein
MFKVGDKYTKKDGTVKTITLFDQLAAFGGVDLQKASTNQIGDIKQWNKLDRFVHGFIVCTRMLKNKGGKKLLKECNIEINNLTMEQILEDHKLVNNL